MEGPPGDPDQASPPAMRGRSEISYRRYDDGSMEVMMPVSLGIGLLSGHLWPIHMFDLMEMVRHEAEERDLEEALAESKREYDAGYEPTRDPLAESDFASVASVRAWCGGDDPCPICREPEGDTRGPTKAVLTCGHQFCEGCLREWMRIRAKCPVCLRDYKSREPDAPDDAVTGSQTRPDRDPRILSHGV